MRILRGVAVSVDGAAWAWRTLNSLNRANTISLNRANTISLNPPTGATPMTDLYFLLLDYILDPATQDAVFPEGALIDMATVERLTNELGIDNFSAQTCVGWSAAVNMQQSFLDAYYPEDGNGISQARIHPGFWPEAA